MVILLRWRLTIDHEGVERSKRWRVFGNNVVVKWDAFAVKRRVYRPDTARLIFRLKSWKPKVAFVKSNFATNVCAAEPSGCAKGASGQFCFFNKD